MAGGKFPSTEGKYNPYYGQFIISFKQIGNEPQVSHVLIKEGFWLSYGDGLTVQSTQNYEGKNWYLLGEAYQGEPNRLCPLKELRNATLQNIDEITSSWAGRWLLVGYDRIFTDACSLLQCFFKKVICSSSKTYGYFFASNPIILQKVNCGQDVTTAVEDKRALELGWVVPPRSGYKDIRVLLPSQCINICDGTIEPRKVLSVSKGIYSYAESLDELIKLYSCILKNIASHNDNIWVPLTGGHDTRFVTAVAHHVGVNAKTYTFSKPYLWMSNADKKLPPIIAKLAGFEHHFISKSSFSDERKIFFNGLSHIYNKIPGTPYYYFVNGYWDYFEKNTAILTGVCGELGRCYLYKLLPTNPTERDLLQTVPATRFNKIAFNELINWWSQNPKINIDNRERFFWETSLAGQAGDTMLQDSFIFQFYKIKKIPMLNCMKAFETILGMDEVYRTGGKYSKDIIEHLFPQAKDIPYNPSDPFHKKILIHLRQFVNNPKKEVQSLHRFLTNLKKSLFAISLHICRKRL